MNFIINTCMECYGEMRTDKDLLPSADIWVCTRCNDKPVDEITDGVAIGTSLEVNKRQLRG